MLESGSDPESYITEYTLVFDDKTVPWLQMLAVVVPATSTFSIGPGTRNPKPESLHPKPRSPEP